MRQSSMPTSVGLLGYGGLIPFLALALMSNGDTAHGILYRGALLLYGSVILSFVGAIHWGVAMIDTNLTDHDRRAAYVWSVVPAVMAWATYILSPIPAALVLIMGFLLQYWRDSSLAQKIQWPVWYLPMRIRLTVVACLALALGTAPQLIY